VGNLVQQIPAAAEIPNQPPQAAVKSPPPKVAANSPAAARAKGPQPGPVPMASEQVEAELREAWMRIALDAPTEVEFVDTPLREGLNILKDYHKIEILFDSEALKEAGIPEDKPVTLTLSEITLESILNLMLLPLNLDWVIRNEVLQVTTRKVADRTYRTEIYTPQDFGNSRDVNALKQLVVETVAPVSWQNAGEAKISTLDGKLIVRQTDRNHREISKFLRKWNQTGLARGE
jgi:hypothetical protein